MTWQIKKVRAADQRALSGHRRSMLNVGNQPAEYGLFIDGKQVGTFSKLSSHCWCCHEGTKPFGLVVGAGSTKQEAAEKAAKRLYEAGY